MTPPPTLSVPSTYKRFTHATSMQLAGKAQAGMQCAHAISDGALKHVPLSTQRQSDAKPEHMQCAHATSEGAAQSPQRRPLPKPDRSSDQTLVDSIQPTSPERDAHVHRIWY